MIERQLDDPLLPAPSSSIGTAVDPSADFGFSLQTGEYGQPAGTNAANAAKNDSDMLGSGVFTSGPGLVGSSGGPLGAAAGSMGLGNGSTSEALGGIGGARQPAPVTGTPAPAPAPAAPAPLAAHLSPLINYPSLIAYRVSRGLPPIQAPQPPPKLRRLGIGGAALQGAR